MQMSNVLSGMASRLSVPRGTLLWALSAIGAPVGDTPRAKVPEARASKATIIMKKTTKSRNFLDIVFSSNKDKAHLLCRSLAKPFAVRMFFPIRRGLPKESA